MRPTATSLWPATNIPDLRLAFQILDVDRDGKISHEDLKTSYTDADDAVINTMMNIADSNKDGYVEYDEFEKILERNTSNNYSGFRLEDVFKGMDEDGDGKVGYGDLRSYVSSSGFEINDDEIKLMVRLGGVDDHETESGVTFDGFMKIMVLVV